MVVSIRFTSFPVAFKAKVQAGIGQLLNETMVYSHKIDIDSVKNDK